jgi:hypothetical protein
MLSVTAIRASTDSLNARVKLRRCFLDTCVLALE